MECILPVGIPPVFVHKSVSHNSSLFPFRFDLLVVFGFVALVEESSIPTGDPYPIVILADRIPYIIFNSKYYNDASSCPKVSMRMHFVTKSQLISAAVPKV